MAKSPSLLDLPAMLPAGDIARTARAIGLSPELLPLAMSRVPQRIAVHFADVQVQIRPDRKAAVKPRGRRKAR